jgi:hypothetical protein
LAAAREIEYAHDRAEVLFVIADFLLKQGQSEMARNLIDELRNAIGKIFDDASRSDSLHQLAVICARLHLYREARRQADRCSSSSDRLTAYTAILREYHIERNPSLARLFAEEAAEVEEED